MIINAHAPPSSRGWIAAAAAAALSAIGLLAATVAAIGGVSVDQFGLTNASDVRAAPPASAARDIPPDFLRLYAQAAASYGLDWAVLAAIGKVECDHGRAHDPSCTREGAVNGARAGGPMQFIESTWARYGLDADGDGRANRWDPADAIYAAANYLRASGAPRDYRRAILAYNHSRAYLAEVEALAARYRDAASATPDEVGSEGEGAGALGDALAARTATPVVFVAGERAMLVPGQGHVAFVPADVPATVQAMVIAGNELQALRYGRDGHPDPRGALEADCSSAVNYVLYRADVRPIEEIRRQNPVAQSYVGWGLPGPGRWVSIYAATAPSNHVFAVIAGLRLDTSHHGTDVGPNRNEDGPRWRILGHVPTWAHWSVRHPQGL
ncbi:MAG: lytic transglycosylase domain-containing protein [Actinobacteria bacterium]|nr:MAG: lytic transglycosylase domain-containing protein [Actinomycetota bacterium]